jgi:hypothetical protein
MGFVAESDTFKGQLVDVLIGAPMETASVEFEAKNPGSWNNSYYYCRYENVYADDGRVMGVHDLLVPNYELVGWHGNVELYSLDGRTIEVPYPEVSAYKKVGWYDVVSYAIIEADENVKKYGYAKALGIMEEKYLRFVLPKEEYLVGVYALFGHSKTQ